MGLLFPPAIFSSSFLGGISLLNRRGGEEKAVSEKKTNINAVPPSSSSSSSLVITFCSFLLLLDVGAHRHGVYCLSSALSGPLSQTGHIQSIIDSSKGPGPGPPWDTWKRYDLPTPIFTQ